MKKSFTLIEILIVIVILGILSTISIDILRETYKSYLKTKEMNSLSFKTDLVLNILASKLQNRIKNSVIAVKCNAQANECNTSGNKEFIPVSAIDNNNKSSYPVLEWLYVSVYSKRGMWNGDKQYVQPGWSGFVDLNKTEIGSGDEYNITSPESNFTIVEKIDQEWAKNWKIDQGGDVFTKSQDVLVFSGSDGRGDFDDINNSYGYYDNNATRVFKISRLTDVSLNVKAVTESNTTTVYEGYYIVRGAMAVVPVYDSKYGDYNLTLRFNYFPWRKTSSGTGEMYMDGNVSVIATHVTQFKFKEDGGILRLYLCITSPSVKLSDYNLTICKEKVVF